MGDRAKSAIGYGVKLPDGFSLPWGDNTPFIDSEDWWFYVSNKREHIDYKELKKFLKDTPTPVKVCWFGDVSDTLLCIPDTIKVMDWDEFPVIYPPPVF